MKDWENHKIVCNSNINNDNDNTLKKSIHLENDLNEPVEMKSEVIENKVTENVKYI